MALYRSLNPGAPRSSSGRSATTDKAVSPSDEESTTSATIDVVNDYDWAINKTKSPPYIILREYKLTRSSIVAGFGHFAVASIESLGSTVSQFLDESIASELTKSGKGVYEKLRLEMGGTDAVAPYDGLYFVKKTGNTYRFPYYVENIRSRNNSWSSVNSGDGQNMIADAVNSGAEFVNKYFTGAFGFGALLEPGAFVERIKFYQPTVGDESVAFKFPLLNTINESSISKNKDLVIKLARNTSPSRKTRSILEPPHLYEVLIPGIRYIKFGIITNYTVGLLGNRRMIEGAITPEAYELSFNINSLTDESGNFLIESKENPLNS